MSEEVNLYEEELERVGHKPFFASLLALSLALIVLWVVTQTGRSSGPRDRFFYWPILVYLSTGIVLWSVIYAWWRGPLGWRLGVLCIFLSYLSVEQFAAPYLNRSYRMGTYTALQDPDHRPKHTSIQKGWNSDSLRCPHESKEFAKAGTNIIIMGDSFTFGMKLKPKHCFPYLVEERLNRRLKRKDVKVANFGWVSSSPLLSWRRLIDIGEDYSPDIVIICVDMTDIRDDIRWRDMLDRRGAYGVIGNFPLATTLLQRVSGSAFAWMFSALNSDMPQKRFFMSEAPLEETREYFAEITLNLARIKAWCDERGVQFATVILPRTYQYSDRESPENWEGGEYTVLGPYSLEPFRYFEELSKEVDYPIYSLLETFQKNEVFPTSFEDDPHWNRKGAQVAASAITKILIEEVAKLEQL